MGNEILKEEMPINSYCHYPKLIAKKTHITGGNIHRVKRKRQIANSERLQTKTECKTKKHERHW